MGSLIALAWHRYLRQLQQNPLRTKALTAAAITGLSDIFAQKILTKHVRNAKRVGAMALYGFIWSGPGAHYWQMFLNWLFKGRNDLATVISKVVIDQLSYGPLCNLLFMSYATVIMEGKPIEFLKQRLKRDFARVQLNGWKVWPLASFINYYFVPLQFRVLFINVVALCWACFLLMRARAASQSKEGLQMSSPRQPSSAQNLAGESHDTSHRAKQL